MDFNEIIYKRQSCRNYNKEKQVSADKITALLEAARLAPSACNSEPYHFTVCKNKKASEIASACMGMGMNKFCTDVPVFIVISEQSYNKTATVGAKIKKNDYRSIDIGIAAAYITARACEEGLSSCILGWFDNDKIKKICSLTNDVRLVIALGYAADGDILREKKRKDLSVLSDIQE